MPGPSNKVEKPEVEPPTDPAGQWFTTHVTASQKARQERLQNPFPVTPEDFIMAESYGQDEIDNTQPAKAAFVINRQILPESLFDWYVSQSFIGYQACAFIAQNWLVNRGCSMKGRDATRNGFKLIFDDGINVPGRVDQKIENLNKKFKLKKRLRQADKFKNVFGISHILFKVRSKDPDYYEKPFNPDGITPGSYGGIIHVDPYWVTPLLTTSAVEEPGAEGFYDPTYWVISGRKYHRSHFVILRGDEVSDVLKPSYLYGGLPITQLVAERAYAAERTANEAPQLALTKRLVIRYIEDLEQAIANPAKFERAMQALTEWRDNYGVYVDDKSNTIDQQDTGLGDFDSLVMTQYQIASGIFGVPATKLLGTSPKGFQSTGEHEIQTYHEELETIQENDLTPIVDRHHLCLMRSHIAPQERIDPFSIDIKWNPLAVMSEQDNATTQNVKAQTYKTVQETGAIDGYDIRETLIADENSGFTGIPAVERPEDLDELPDLEYLSEAGEAQPAELPTPPTTEQADQTTTPLNGSEITSSKKADKYTTYHKEPARAPNVDLLRKRGDKWVVLNRDGKTIASCRTKREAISKLQDIKGSNKAP